MWAAGWAWVEKGGGGTFAFQPVMLPDSDAKMNVAGPDAIPDVTTKPLVGLNTCPVGSPPGMLTTSGTADTGVFFSPPRYSVATSAPLSDTHTGVLGPADIPQGFTRLGSVS